MIWRCGRREGDLTVPAVMGIVNVTPDSFSDGGRYFEPTEAARRVRNLAEEGALLVDLGAESTRPGATPVGTAEEWARLEPVLARLAPVADLFLSVDTYHPETARRAVAAGVSVVNCVKPEAAEAMIVLANETGCGLILPARRAETIRDYLRRLEDPARLAVDPEIGFDTTREEDVALLRNVRELAAVAPVCLGLSRKRIVKHLVGERIGGKDVAGSVALALWGAEHGASLLRVHDVAETRRALAVFAALSERSVETRGGGLS